MGRGPRSQEPLPRPGAAGAATGPGHRVPEGAGPAGDWDSAAETERTRATRDRVTALAAALAATRDRLAAAAADIARTEEKVAEVHEDLAGHRPGHAEQYRRTAEEARRAADRAREIARLFRSNNSQQ